VTTRLALATLALATGLAHGAAAQTTAADSSQPPRAVTMAYSYTGDLVTVVSGGARRGSAFAGVAGAQVTLLLPRLVGWRGARVFAYLLDTHGGAPSGLVGDVQGVSNLQAPPAIRLEEAWLQQNMLANHVSLLVGRYDLSSEFYVSHSANLFTNSSFGMGAELGLSGVEGPSVFPFTSVGARLDVKPSPNTVLRLAALDGVPVDRPGGGVHPFAPGDGAIVVGEVAILSRPDTSAAPRSRRFQIGRGLGRSYSGKVAIGGWYYTARFPDLVDTLPSGAPVEHRGSGGAYLIADQTLWAARSGSPGPLTGFVQLGLGDGRVNQIGSYLGAGLTLTGPIPQRTNDLVGLAVAAARNGSHFVRAQPAAALATSGETAIELTYVAQLGSWITLQPNLQYVIAPGGTHATPSALVPGLRIGLSH
jgi:porin